jgi:ATP adenylyltransferase
MKMTPSIMFNKGTLRETIEKTSANALAAGALLPIPTNYEFVEDGGVRFFVRILSTLARKDEERKKREKESGRTTPFLPYEKNLFVANITESHVAVLNKFNVLEHHLLIITREFEYQEDLLTKGDFEALGACLDEYDGLGFYNGGQAAGASQSHKHLQLVPLPLAPEGPPIPIEPLLDGARFKDESGVVPGFPFLHTFARLDTDASRTCHESAEKIFALYCEMLRRVGMKAPRAEGRQRQSGPYCLIVTREWMLLVPRSREFFEDISINSLGYAGALLVRNEEQMAVLKRRGPMTVLKNVSIPYK